MLTIFATPKPFVGHNGVIQRNAIASWTKLVPRPEIILLGDSEGIEAIASELGVIHCAEVECNEFGTPLVHGLFEQAQAIGIGDRLMYINSDIILLSDVMPTIERIALDRFMMTGQRWNLDLTELIDFEEADWEKKVRSQVAVSGHQEGAQAMDYFVFSRGLYPEIPAFAIGRPSWDNWLLYETLRLGVPVIDGSKVILAVHQNHDYNHHPRGKVGVWQGEEAKISRNLVGSWNPAIFRLEGATYEMTPEGLEKPKLTLNQHKNCLLMDLVLRSQKSEFPKALEPWIVMAVNTIHQAPGAIRKRLA
jgi:hypothetical protein